MPVGQGNPNKLTTKDLFNLALQMQQMKMATEKFEQDKKIQTLQMQQMQQAIQDRKQQQELQETQRQALGDFAEAALPQPKMTEMPEPTTAIESPEEQQSAFDRIYSQFSQERQKRQATVGLAKSGALGSLPTTVQEQLFGIEGRGQRKSVYEQKVEAINEAERLGLIPPERAQLMREVQMGGSTFAPTGTTRQAQELAQLQSQVTEAIQNKTMLDPNILAEYSARKDADQYMVLAALKNQIQTDPNIPDEQVTRATQLERELKLKTADYTHQTVTNEDGTTSTLIYDKYDLATQGGNAQPVKNIKGTMSWRPGVMGEFQKDWIQGTQMLDNMEMIRDLYDKYGAENFTYISRAQINIREFAQKLGIASDDEATRIWKQHREMLYQSLEQAFQAWRKIVTGVQAGEKELQYLRNAYMTGELSGDKLEGFFAGITLQTLNKLRNIEAIQPSLLPTGAIYSGKMADNIFLGKGIPDAVNSRSRFFQMIYPKGEVPPGVGNERPEYEDPNDPDEQAFRALQKRMGMQ